MQQNRTFLLLHIAQPAAQRRQVVTVHRAEITEAHLLEQHAARQERLHTVLDLLDGLGRHAADERHTCQQIANVALAVLVEMRQPRLVETRRQGADARADRHLVVIKDDEQVFTQAAGVIQRLEDDARRQGAVADHRHAAAVAFAHQVVAGFQAQRTRHAATGVAGHKQIVIAFVRIRITHEAAARAQAAELGVSTRDELMRINLMAGVPN